MRTQNSEAALIAEVTSLGEVLPKVAEALPKELDPKAFKLESQQLGESITSVNDANRARTKAVAEKRERVKVIQQMIKRIRASVKGRFGDDSLEYELVGGKRASNRKKPVRKPKVVKAA